MPPRSLDAPPESDRFPDAPHPRETTRLIGHTKAERTLLDSYRSGRLSPAWILGGPEGVGKATLAWRFIRFLVVHPDPRSPAVQAAQDLSVPAEHPALRRLAALSHGDVAVLRREWNERSKKHYGEIRIDDARQALTLFRRASGEGGWRICLVDSADDLNRSSANALLKLVEEPPPRALFLFVAHRPARLLVTLRSRCRSLALDPLPDASVSEAVGGLGAPWSETPADALQSAARRAQGSVRAALRLLQGETLAMLGALDGALAGLPRLDWSAAGALAELAATRDGEDAYRAFLSACYDWLDGRVQAGGSPRRLHPYAEVFSRIAAKAGEVDAYNLDRKAFVLTVFADLEHAAQAAAAA